MTAPHLFDVSACRRCRPAPCRRGLAPLCGDELGRSPAPDEDHGAKVGPHPRPMTQEVKPDQRRGLAPLYDHEGGEQGSHAGQRADGAQGGPAGAGRLGQGEDQEQRRHRHADCARHIQGLTGLIAAPFPGDQPPSSRRPERPGTWRRTAQPGCPQPFRAVCPDRAWRRAVGTSLPGSSGSPLSFLGTTLRPPSEGESRGSSGFPAGQKGPGLSPCGRGPHWGTWPPPLRSGSSPGSPT
jgi:hypothetical protein